MSEATTDDVHDRLQRVLALHHPVDEEAEVWGDDPEHADQFPEFESKYLRGDR